MATLFFGGHFRFDLKKPNFPCNDRIIFSKGHASPLFYALYVASGVLSFRSLRSYRKFQSMLEGHPTPRFKYAEASTGSLGQGLSIGLGMALNARYLDKTPSKVYVLLGDSEMTEGSVWEALQLASHYKLDNLVAIVDVNGLGQRGKTMYGHDLSLYKRKAKAFGWEVVVVQDGHNIGQISRAYSRAGKKKGKPTMILARTVKGKGVSFLENAQGWHGRALRQEEYKQAIQELGTVSMSVRGKIRAPARTRPHIPSLIPSLSPHSFQEVPMETRKAYGITLAQLGMKNSKIVALDAEVKNSTYAELFERSFPKRFFEMFIAEQNMVGAALGLSLRGKIPFVSTFAAFFSRAADQIRMAQYSGSKANIKFVGSHAGVSIGQDGPSQMGLEDIALFRTIRKSVIVYPADAVSTRSLVGAIASYKGICYLRTTRMKTPILYKKSETFPIGKSKTLRSSKKDAVTLLGAGVTLFECLAAQEKLAEQGIRCRVIDCYSVKPIDRVALKKAARETAMIFVVEDHYKEGGMGDAVREALWDVPTRVCSLAVEKVPRSGSPRELLSYEGISCDAIVRQVNKHRKVFQNAVFKVS
jgi:transketolase